MKRSRVMVAALVMLAGGLWEGAARGAEELLDRPVTQGDVTIRLPKGWSVQQRANAVLVAFAPTADKEEAGEFVTNFTIVAKPAVGKVDGEAQQKLLQRAFGDYHAMERPTLVTVNGLQGLFFGGAFTSNGLLLRSRQYLFTVEGQVYVLTTTGLASKWAAYVPMIEASVATFAVKADAPAGAPIALPGAVPMAPGRVPTAAAAGGAPVTGGGTGSGTGAMPKPVRPTMTTATQPAGR